MKHVTNTRKYIKKYKKKQICVFDFVFYIFYSICYKIIVFFIYFLSILIVFYCFYWYYLESGIRNQGPVRLGPGRKTVNKSNTKQNHSKNTSARRDAQ